MRVFLVKPYPRLHGLRCCARRDEVFDLGYVVDVVIILEGVLVPDLVFHDVNLTAELWAA